jgi:hypothetical protein
VLLVFVVADVVESPCHFRIITTSGQFTCCIFFQQVDVSSPRVKPMGDDYKRYAATNPQQDTRPGTLKSKSCTTVKGQPDRKSFFNGVGTQVAGVSSNKRYVCYTPGVPLE